MASTNQDTGYLEFAARALPVMGALLPAIGVGVRWLAFYLSGIQPRLRVVSSLSLTELAMLGFQSMFEFILVLVVVGIILKSLEPLLHTLVRAPNICRRVLDRLLKDYSTHSEIWKVETLQRRLNRFPQGRVSVQFVLSLRAVEREIAGSTSREMEDLARDIEAVTPRWLGRTRADLLRSEPRSGATLTLSLLGLLLIAIIFFAPEFPTLLLLLLFSVVGLGMVDRAMQSQIPLTFARALPAIAIFLFGGGISQAVHLGTDAASFYNFTEDAELQDGYYIEIGNEGSEIFLLSCDDEEKLIRTRSTFFLSATSSAGEPIDRPRFDEILFEGDDLELGLKPACPRESEG